MRSQLAFSREFRYGAGTCRTVTALVIPVRIVRSNLANENLANENPGHLNPDNSVGSRFSTGRTDPDPDAGVRRLLFVVISALSDRGPFGSGFFAEVVCGRRTPSPLFCFWGSCFRFFRWFYRALPSRSENEASFPR
jgi:hypothetical protein